MPNSDGSLTGTRNKLSNKPRERGMSPPQEQVEEYETGETVHLRIDPSIPEGRFHPRFNGHTGEVVGQQGAAFRVRIDDGGKEKTLIARAAHLQRQTQE
jgi:large subunit ribosomal protein L21e